jgi:hypothetical protein
MLLTPWVWWTRLVCLLLLLGGCSERQGALSGLIVPKPGPSETVPSLEGKFSLRNGEQLLYAMARVTGIPIDTNLRFNYETLIAQLPAAPDAQGFGVARAAARERLASLFCVRMAHLNYPPFSNGTEYVDARSRMFGAPVLAAMNSGDLSALDTVGERMAMARAALSQVLGPVDGSDPMAMEERNKDVIAIAEFLDELIRVSGVGVRHAAYGVCMAALTHTRLLLY